MKQKYLTASSDANNCWTEQSFIVTSWHQDGNLDFVQRHVVFNIKARKNLRAGMISLFCSEEKYLCHFQNNVKFADSIIFMFKMLKTVRCIRHNLKVRFEYGYKAVKTFCKNSSNP